MPTSLTYLVLTNHNLISLEFHKCFSGFDIVIPIVAEALRQNKTMKKLSMPRNYIIRKSYYNDPQLQAALSKMLEVNQTLEKLEITVDGYLTGSLVVSMLQRDESRNIQVYINLYYGEEAICSLCVPLDQRIHFSPELKKIELPYTCVVHRQRITSDREWNRCPIS